jgi:hypothetical protein
MSYTFNGPPRFVSGYRGETDYVWRGKRYSIRFQAIDGGYYNGNYYHEGIEPLVGCLYNRDLPATEFPSAEAIAAFQEMYPDVVPARWTAGFKGIEYQGERPATCMSKWGYVYAVWYAEQQWQANREFYSSPDREAYGLPVLEVAHAN